MAMHRDAVGCWWIAGGLVVFWALILNAAVWPWSHR